MKYLIEKLKSKHLTQGVVWTGAAFLTSFGGSIMANVPTGTAVRIGAGAACIAAAAYLKNPDKPVNTDTEGTIQ